MNVMLFVIIVVKNILYILFSMYNIQCTMYIDMIYKNLKNLIHSRKSCFYRKLIKATSLTYLQQSFFNMKKNIIYKTFSVKNIKNIIFHTPTGISMTYVK